MFSAKVMGPVSNIYSYSAGSFEERNSKNSLKKITENIRWRDIDADISSQGFVVFSSNREADESIDISRSDEAFDLYLYRGDSTSLRSLTATPQDEMSPKFSPDGTRVAFIRERKTLVVLALGSVNERVQFEAEEILDFDWSPDGKSLAVAARNQKRGEILLLECTRDCLQQRASISELASFLRQSGVQDHSVAQGGCAACGSAVTLAWSPTGDRLAYVFHPDTPAARSLWIMEMTGDPVSSRATVPLQLSAQTHQVQDAPSWSRDGQSLLYAALVDYRFHYDESRHRKVYEGSMQVFIAGLDGKRAALTDKQVAAHAPVFMDSDRVAYLQAEDLSAREYALVIRNLADASEQRIFDGVARGSGLAVRP
ncbi:TolB family protein [Microbulbifer mangrovi]|uniref:TolB family protein n=1 Tax=Microbulbifer mangrovi TaxID=927787 RepID=UPI0013010874|nr:PD40 domain-containing protein [Microbulbifer mangrovi]